jgi:hypothetical protein
MQECEAPSRDAAPGKRNYYREQRALMASLGIALQDGPGRPRKYTPDEALQAKRAQNRSYREALRRVLLERLAQREVS